MCIYKIVKLSFYITLRILIYTSQSVLYHVWYPFYLNMCSHCLFHVFCNLYWEWQCIWNYFSGIHRWWPWPFPLIPGLVLDSRVVCVWNFIKMGVKGCSYSSKPFSVIHGLVTFTSDFLIPKIKRVHLWLKFSLCVKIHKDTCTWNAVMIQ